MVNDEEATFIELNWLCGTKHNISFGVWMPKKRMHVQASVSRGWIEESFDSENVDAWNLVFDENIISKIFPISLRENFLLTPMETILIIPGELKYLEGLVKLVRRKKDVEKI